MTDSGNTLNTEEVDFLLSAAGSDESPQGNGEPAGDEQAVTMRGDLEQINLSDIFQTLAMTKMEGVLRVRNPLEQRQVYFNDGYVRILVPMRIATRRLGQRLVQAGLIQPDQLRAALVRQRKEHHPLGHLLVEEGLVQQDQVDEIAGMQVSEDLFALFTWRHGTFEFYKGEITDEDQRAQFDSCPEFEVSSLLLEVARRADEWESILSVVSSLDEVPVRLVEVPEDVELDDAGRALVYGADGRATYRDLAEHTTLGLFEVSRVARDLVRQGYLGNVTDTDLVAVAEAEAEAGHHKNALMLLQTLRDRPGERSLDIVRSMVIVLDKAGERRLAGTVLLELAQLQADPELALELAREARALAPHDAGTISFLRTTLLAHSSPDSAELEQCTIDLLDALIDEDRLDTAMEILADARATGTMRPGLLLREARARQKLRDIEGAANAMFELAEVHRSQGDRQRTIEAYQAILRIDPQRKDVQKLLKQIRQTRAGRIIRVTSAAICVCLLGAMGVVFWQQNRYTAAVQNAGRQISELLQNGDRAAAREALAHWSEVLGEGEATEDLRSRVDFADAAEHTRLTKLARKQLNERLTFAAETLGNGDLRGALAIYDDLHEKSPFAAEVAEVVGTRIDAALTEIEQTAKTLANRLPVDPSRVIDRKGLATNLADLQSICRPALQRIVAELEQLHAESKEPKYLPEDVRTRIADVLLAHRAVFAKATELTKAYTEALERNQTERRLDPMFKQAIKLEEEHDFAAALELYRTLEREPAGDATLRAHFRDHIARNATICRLMEALNKATAAGDFGNAQQQYRALVLAFPDVPFARLVRLPLHIESQPAGARVSCNGTVVGNTPCTLSYLPVDENMITVSSPGFRDEVTTVTGDQVGTFRTALLLQPTFERKHDSLVEAAPLADGSNQIVVCDRAGSVTSIAPSDGHTLWTFRSGDLSGLLSHPLAHGDDVLIASLDGELRALDRATGAPRWSLSDLPTEVRPAMAGDYLLLATTNHRLVAVDTSTRAIVAQTVLPTAARGTLQVQGSTVFCTTDDGQVLTYTLPNLAAHWGHKFAGWGELSTLATAEKTLVADDRGHVAALDPATGTVRWQVARDAETFGSPILVDNTVVLAARQRLLRFSAGDGSDLPGISQGEEPWSEPPLRVGSRLLAPSGDGSIHVIDLATTSTLYRIEGSKRGTRVLPVGEKVMVALPDRRILFFDQLR